MTYKKAKKEIDSRIELADRAIRNVERVFNGSPDIVSNETIESVEFALEAMNKQYPMKVHDGDSCVCGHGLGLYRPTPNYCPQCGQALDWSEE